MTDGERDRLATPLSITLERMAKAESLDLMKWLVDQMHRECLVIYDSYVPWIAVLQRFILQRCDRKSHDLALNWAAEHGLRPFVHAFAGLAFRERVQRLAMFLRASGSTFSVTEDSQRVCFEVDVWGAARWWRDQADWQEISTGDGARKIRYPCYGQYKGEVAFPMLRGPDSLTGGRDLLPSNLALEVLFLEILPIELFGHPLAVINLGEKSSEPVRLDVYKDPAQCPDSVYESVSMPKPMWPMDREETPASVFSDFELQGMAIPLAIQIEDAASNKDWGRLLRISARMDVELVSAKDPLGIMIAGLLSWIARHLGEDAVESALRETAEVVMGPFIDSVRDLSSVDALRAWCIAWRAHGSTFWIEEEDECFVLRGRPLGACARMWASGYQAGVERISESRVRYPTFGCFSDPASFHVMRDKHDITHGKLGFPVYSCHCVMLHEIYPIDQLGYPLWVEQHPLGDPDGETVHIHYKDRSAWPAHYYEAVGRNKPRTLPA